jgi:hypothetical protein
VIFQMQACIITFERLIHSVTDVRNILGQGNVVWQTSTQNIVFAFCTHCMGTFHTVRSVHVCMCIKL